MAIQKSLGFILLSVWLIIIGASGIFGLTFSGFPIITNVLAIAAGILILLGQ
jgi:hypothetical protein